MGGRGYALRMDEAQRDEVRALLEGARQLLDWEEQLSGVGIPRVEVAPPTLAAPAPAPSGPRRGGPSVALPVVAPDEATRPLDLPDDLDEIAKIAASCTQCALHAGRTRSVFARGKREAELVFVGEGPGYNEDQRGEPFVGAAGQLLDKMIAAMGYARDDVYICNVVKCRPPENRTPTDAEAAACEPYLAGQLRLVQPKVIVALGKCATERLGCMPETERKWRGVFREYRGIPVMPTYHPAFLLRSPQFKRPVWEDLQAVMRKLGR